LQIVSRIFFLKPNALNVVTLTAEAMQKLWRQVRLYPIVALLEAWRVSRD
jgi:septin family protein